jgi:hypothetical protein
VELGKEGDNVSSIDDNAHSSTMKDFVIKKTDGVVALKQPLHQKT